MAINPVSVNNLRDQVAQQQADANHTQASVATTKNNLQRTVESLKTGNPQGANDQRQAVRAAQKSEAASHQPRASSHSINIKA